MSGHYLTTGQASRRRIFHTIPSRVDSQAGTLLTSVLFAIVMGKLTGEVARHIVAIGRAKCFQSELEIFEKIAAGKTPICFHPTWSDALNQRSSALWHLAAAATITLCGAVSYYNIRRLPRLSVQFVNFPLVLALLDIAIVALYYLLVESAEVTVAQQDARPEAFIVMLIFALYVLWDIVGYRIQKDDFAQVALRITPARHVKFGYRRCVTLAFSIIVTVASLTYSSLYASGFLTGAGSTAAVDIFLIFCAVSYRIAQPYRHDATHYRGQQTSCNHRQTNEKRQQYKHGSDSKIAATDLRRLLPDLDSLTQQTIIELGRSRLNQSSVLNTVPLWPNSVGGIAHLLSRAHAENKRSREEVYFEYLPSGEREQQASLARFNLELTDFGRFIYEICEKEQSVPSPDDTSIQQTES